ncbi:hypothetical protein BLD44_019710 [Mastigocladus laminosus UU774]|nr:hypothetical protein BLD44_019710 [Mastigocladus laminosus UU774]
MKTTIKNYITTKQIKFFTALILTGILSVGSNFALLKSATAAPRNILPEKVNQILEVNHKRNGLPLPVARAVLKDVSRTQGVLPSKLKIAEYQQQTWSDGCLGLPKPDEFCTQALVPGWRVIVSNGTENWIYHTNSNGRSLRLANPNTSVNNQSKNLPTSVKNAVLAAASQLTKLSTSKIRVVNFKEITTDGCLGLGRPDEACIEIAQQAWEVNLQAGKQRLVYRANRDGSQVRLNQSASSSALPKSIVDAILADAEEELGVPFSRLRIIGVERREWPDSCLGISEPLILCAPSIVPGWRVTVSNGKQRLVYRVGEPDTIRLDKQASKITGNNLQPVPISTSDLPPLLESGVVFREISRGGFIGRTYETVLLDDGLLIRTRMGDANDSERSVRRVSLRKLRQFQQLLEKKGVNEFQNLSYPAPSGAADYIIHTLTSSNGTVQYNDISHNRLPQNLQVVVAAWNQLLREAQG